MPTQDSATCPLCSGVTHTVLTRTLRRGHGTAFHCADCDLGFLVPSKLLPGGYYNGEYRDTVSHRADGGGTNPQEMFDTYRRYQDSRLAAVTPHLKPGTSILEVGASAGQFLHHITAARRCAIEPDRRCCDFMESIGIETDSEFLRSSRFYREKFDIVCAFQVMEHTDDPVSFLKDIRHVLRPGGVAFVEVPNLADALRSVWGVPEYEPFYFHAEHLFYFSMESLLSVAQKAGFTTPQIQFTQDYNLINHLHWITTKGPQADCHIGLAPIALHGKDSGMAAWLSKKLAALNAEYVSMLESSGETSNIMLVLQNS